MRGLLGSRSDALGLSLELLAGADGLDRVITDPHPQKTGLALAGFQEYLRPGRVLVFGESEIRYLELLDPAAREQTLRLVLSLDFPCVLITGGFAPPAELAIERGYGSPQHAASLNRVSFHDPVPNRHHRPRLRPSPSA